MCSLSRLSRVASSPGVDVGSQPSADGVAPPAPPPYNPNLSELENFTARLSEEQREHFKRVIEEQVRLSWVLLYKPYLCSLLVS